MKHISLNQYLEYLVDKRCKVSTVSYRFRYTISYDQKFELLKEEVKLSNNLTKHLFIRYMNNSRWYWYHD